MVFFENHDATNRSDITIAKNVFYVMACLQEASSEDRERKESLITALSSSIKEDSSNYEGFNDLRVFLNTNSSS
jgi:hypothetical protein